MDALITANGHRAFVFPSTGMGQGHDGWIARCLEDNFFAETHESTNAAHDMLVDELQRHIGAPVSA